MNQAMKITLRRLSENDWREFSRIRLQALQTDPRVFGSGYEKESRFVEDNWRIRLKNNVIFLIESGETPIGMTSVGIDINDATGKTAILWGSWLAPAFRRRGISALIYRTRLEWAKSQPNVERIVAAYRVSNPASKNALRKHGFVETKREPFDWADGTSEDLVSCELVIKS